MIIQALRRKRGWSQQQLAEVSGTSLRTIQRIEAGATPSLETLKSLAAVFEVSVEDLADPATTTAENKTPPQEALAMRQVGQLREFYIHAVAYGLVCTAVVVALLFLSPDTWWGGPLLWLVWGMGLLIHAVKTFWLRGSWERRQIARRLERPS